MAMSGISASDDCNRAINDLRLKKSRYVILHIVNTSTIEVKKVGERGATFEDFCNSIDKTAPCYAAYDFEYATNEGSRDKLILISWIPDTNAPRTKMLYSSSRDALNSLTEGFQPIQANDASEIEYEEIARKVKSHRIS